jgi:hypothetical protein
MSANEGCEMVLSPVNGEPYIVDLVKFVKDVEQALVRIDEIHAMLTSELKGEMNEH